MPNPNDDLALVGAITGSIGAATGIAALGWNIRVSLTADRLHVTFYAYEASEPKRVPINGGQGLALGPTESRTIVHVRIVNIGTRTAHIESIATTRNPGWTRKMIGLRSLSVHARTRWWLRWAIRRNYYTKISDSDLGGNKLATSIEPGEARLVEVDDRERVAEYLADRRWIVVDTGIRTYVKRIQPPEKPKPEHT